MADADDRITLGNDSKQRTGLGGRCPGFAAHPRLL